MQTLTLNQRNLEKSQEVVSDLGLEMALKLSELRQRFSTEQMPVGKPSDLYDHIQTPASLGRSYPTHASTY